VFLEQGLQAQRVVGQAVAVFQVAVVEWQRVVRQVDKGDFASGGTGRLHRGLNEFSVPGITADAAGKGENLGHELSLSKTGDCIGAWKIGHCRRGFG